MKWIRIWTEETVTGSTFQELDAETRAVWFSLLPLAGMNTPEGCISAFNGTVGMHDDQLSTILRLDIDMIRRGLKRLVEVGKVEILANGAIRVCNWGHYQGYSNEYERQKCYRENKKRQLGLQEKNTEKTQKTQFTSISISKSKSRGLQGGEEIRLAFDKFWAVYPNPILKNQSFGAFVANVQTLEDREAIILAAKNYATHCNSKGTDIKYIKYPSSWLKDWRDWLEIKSQKPRRANKPEIEALLARGWARATRRNNDGGVGIGSTSD